MLLLVPINWMCTFSDQLTSMLFSSTKQKPREVLVTLSLINLMSFKLSAHTLDTACLTYRELPDFLLWYVSCTDFSLHTEGSHILRSLPSFVPCFPNTVDLHVL